MFAESIVCKCLPKMFWKAGLYCIVGCLSSGTVWLDNVVQLSSLRSQSESICNSKRMQSTKCLQQKEGLHKELAGRLSVSCSHYQMCCSLKSAACAKAGFHFVVLFQALVVLLFL